jgi:hypothetical protein
MSKLLPFALGAFALGATLLPADALAQYAHQPFFEQTVPESQALGLETIGDKLLLATTFSAPLDHELVDQLDDMTEADLGRFFGTLQSKDKKLASSLSKALDAVADTAGDGKDAADAVKTAQALLAKAYDTVLAKKLRDDPSFKAGLMVNLLLADNGVSEGDYSDAWAALQRVKQLWSELKPLGTAQRQADGEKVIEELDKLFPSATPPKSMAGRTDDDAEDPAQRLASIMEEVAGSDLYPDRDLPRLTGHLADVTAVACTAYAKGRDKIAAESLYAAFDHYSGHISETAGLVEPELQKKVSALFGKLINAKDDDDDDAKDDDAKDDDAKGGNAKDDDDDAIAIPASPVKACGQLKQAFVELKTAFGN